MNPAIAVKLLFLSFAVIFLDFWTGKLFLVKGFIKFNEILMAIRGVTLRAEVIENNGNVALLKANDGRKIEIFRKDHNQTVEVFLTHFAIGNAFPMRYNAKALRLPGYFVAAGAIVLGRRAFQCAVFAWESLIDGLLWLKWKALCYRAKIWNMTIGLSQRLCDRAIAYLDRKSAEAKASEGEFYPDGLCGELEYFIDCAKGRTLAAFFFVVVQGANLFLSVLRFVLQVDSKELVERA